jgi:hypothetical protein
MALLAMTLYLIRFAEMGMALLRVIWGKSIMGAEHAGLGGVKMPILFPFLDFI